MKQVLLSGLRKERTAECCNIARAAKSLNKIAAVGGQKFPAIVMSEKKIEPIKCYDTVTDRAIVRPLGQRFTGLVVETIDPRPVVGKIVNATRWEVDPSIRYARENDLIWDIDINDKVERVALFSKPSQARTQKLRKKS